MINPHNPDFITKVPWYLGESGPSLKHHNIQKSDHFLSLNEAESLVKEKVAKQKELKTKRRVTYQKGACKNCGATTHKERDCVERPRSLKKAAWKSGLDIAPDEVSLYLENHGKISYDAKRDNWGGYDTAVYNSTVVSRFDKLEEERKVQKETRKEEKETRKQKLRDERAMKKALHKPNENEEGSDNSGNECESGSSDDEHELDERQRDEDARDFQDRAARQGGLGGAGMKVSVRNLRIREDTPKYLRNLDLNSAFYDGKTRSMRANPNPDQNPEDLAFAGDNFVRHTGDALKMASSQVLCWDMQARGENIDVFSNPTQAQMMHTQHSENSKSIKTERINDLLKKYGNASQEMDSRLLLGQTEAYKEYTKDGRLKKAVGKVTSKTKYEEDVYTNNHSSIWGSYFNMDSRRWGYRCCHSCIRNSFCTGDVGREQNDAKEGAIDKNQERKMSRLLSKDGCDNTLSAVVVNRNDVYGESCRKELDEGLVRDALERVKASERPESSEKKRSYNSMENVNVTVEDMEAYRLTKISRDDPMANFLQSDELMEYDDKR